MQWVLTDLLVSQDLQLVPQKLNQSHIVNLVKKKIGMSLPDQKSGGGKISVTFTLKMIQK